MRISIDFLLGAILSLFLAPDGGPREGAIRLPPEKLTTVDTIPEEPSTPVDELPSPRKSLRHRLSQKLSGYFAKRVPDAHDDIPTAHPADTPMRLSSSVRQSSASRLRTQSRASHADGSAYGYGFRNRLASNVSQSLAGRRGSLASTIARRRQSNAMSARAGSTSRGNEGGELNFAQRLLMANEFAVTNMADLWVAAAINADNEDVFLSDTEFGDENENPFQDEEEEEDSPTRIGRSSLAAPSPGMLAPPSPARTGRPSVSSARRPSNVSIVPRLGSPRRPLHRPSLGQVADTSVGTPRRVSSSVPAIFTHTGVRSPSINEASLPAQPLLPREPGDAEAGIGDGLAPIMEDQRQSVFTRREQQDTDEPLDMVSEKQPSILSQLPIMIILQ